VSPLKNTLNRRSFGKLVLAGGASLCAPALIAAPKARIIVIGGGPGGATIARYLKRDAPQLDVVLLEPKRNYTTCFFSNLYLSGFNTFESITHSYKPLRERYQVNLIHDRAEEIDPVAHLVRTKFGRTLGYDKLVVAPGIDFKFEDIEGYGPDSLADIPHAYRGGWQSRLLKRKIQTMKEGGTFILCPPNGHYRCPPAPYERASMVAWYLRHQNKAAKIIILDSKNKFSKQDLFEEGWETHYPDMIEWLPMDITGGIKAVHPKSMEIITEDEVFQADAANIIPPQKAGLIAHRAGLTDETGWCPIHPATMESKLARDIHVIGDAADAAAMPKSAVAANSQAKAVAMILRAELTGSPAFEPKFRNACWSLIAPDDSVALGASYKAGKDHFITTGVYSSQTEETRKTRRRAAREARGWYAGVTKDIFG